MIKLPHIALNLYCWLLMVTSKFWLLSFCTFYQGALATTQPKTLNEFKKYICRLLVLVQQTAFLSKIQNLISEKTKRKIILLSCKKFVKTQFSEVVEFPSIFWIQFFKVVGFPSNFWIQFFKVVEFLSDFWFFVRNVTTSKN